MIEIRVGKMRTLPSGEVENMWRTVKFVGDVLANQILFDEDEDGNEVYSRGISMGLYQLEDGRLLVERNTWSEEGSEYSLTTIYFPEPGDFEPGGEFESLAAYLPMTIEEAAAWSCWYISD